MRPTALTSALAQKLSLPTLLISDMALVFWYTEPCTRQRVLCGAALRSPGLKQQLWGLHRVWCPLQRPANTRWPEGPESHQTTSTRVSGCTRPLWMEATDILFPQIANHRGSGQGISTDPSCAPGTGLPTATVPGVCPRWGGACLPTSHPSMEPTTQHCAGHVGAVAL